MSIENTIHATAAWALVDGPTEVHNWSLGKTIRRDAREGQTYRLAPDAR